MMFVVVGESSCNGCWCLVGW